MIWILIKLLTLFELKLAEYIAVVLFMENSKNMTFHFIFFFFFNLLLDKSFDSIQIEAIKLDESTTYRHSIFVYEHPS